MEICKQTVGGWKDVNIQEIQVEKVTGGLTNLLTKVTIPKLRTNGSSPHQVLVRQYGIDNEEIINRNVEHKIFEKFSELGLGPSLHGYFTGGRVEEFLEARPLRMEEFPQYIKPIARQIAKIHHCQIELDRTPTLFDTLLRWAANARNIHTRRLSESTPASPPSSPPRNSSIFSIPQSNLTPNHNQVLLESIDVDLIEREIEDIRKRLNLRNSPVMFCHNDLNAGNMLVNVKGEISVIDYEYGSYNFRGFDLGNFFCEWTMNYKYEPYPKFKIESALWPNQAQQQVFFHEYILQTKQLNGEQNPTVTQQEIQKLQLETEQFSLCSHLLWSLWGIIQYDVSEIHFGFLEYSLQRFELYLKNKRRIFGTQN